MSQQNRRNVALAISDKAGQKKKEIETALNVYEGIIKSIDFDDSLVSRIQIDPSIWQGSEDNEYDLVISYGKFGLHQYNLRIRIIRREQELEYSDLNTHAFVRNGPKESKISLRHLFLVSHYLEEILEAIEEHFGDAFMSRLNELQSL